MAPRSEASSCSPEDWSEPISEQPWPEIASEAFYGLAGEISDAINPMTEADPVAVLAQTLAVAGCAFGQNAYCRVGETKHYPNLFEIVIGSTSKARKGTSYDPVEALILRADSALGDRVRSGLSSGEGIIHAALARSSRISAAPLGE